MRNGGVHPDAGNSAAKAKRIDFGAAIAAALVKKKVPAKMIFAGASASFTQFEGSIQVVDRKNNFQSAAEAFAKHFNDDYLKKLNKP